MGRKAMPSKAVLSAVASVMFLVAWTPLAQADVWNLILSGQMSLLDALVVGDEQLTYLWDPADIVAGTDLSSPFACGPLLGAVWRGLLNGSSSGGTLRPRDRVRPKSIARMSCLATSDMQEIRAHITNM